MCHFEQGNEPSGLSKSGVS